MEVRGQLMGICTFLDHVSLKDQTQSIRLGGKCLYLPQKASSLNHLASDFVALVILFLHVLVQSI